MAKVANFKIVLIKYFLVSGAVFLWCGRAKGQNGFEQALRLKIDSLISERARVSSKSDILLPNNSVQSIMTPTGWGGGNSTYIFGVVGGVYPALYTTPNKADLAAAVGLSTGNSSKIVNLSLSLNITRVSELRDMSANIVLSRQILKGSSVSVGALQLFASPKVSDAPEASYYIAFSHAAQGIRSRTNGYSGLSYTIGYGTGRFLHMSPMDIFKGKGKYGTGFFANVSYEIIRQININAEWSGMNLGFSSGVRPIRGSALTFGFGVFNLTNYSGDRVQYMGSLGIPILLDKKIENRKQRRERQQSEQTPIGFRGGENGLIIR